jgi:hypothetical protein
VNWHGISEALSNQGRLKSTGKRANAVLSNTFIAASVSAGAISMKLGVRISLGNSPRAFFDFRDLTYFVAYRRPS